MRGFIGGSSSFDEPLASAQSTGLDFPHPSRTIHFPDPFQWRCQGQSHSRTLFLFARWPLIPGTCRRELWLHSTRNPQRSLTTPWSAVLTKRTKFYSNLTTDLASWQWVKPFLAHSTSPLPFSVTSSLLKNGIKLCLST